MQKLGDYEFLITLYHSKNLTQAAQALFVSQPALTKRLQQIEHELDTVIVYRNVKGVQFTPEGEYIVQYAMRSLEEYKELRRAFMSGRKRRSPLPRPVRCRTRSCPSFFRGSESCIPIFI